MRLRDYIDLSVLLEGDRSSSQERRTFGLEHQEIKDDPIAQLKVWVAQHRHRLGVPLLSEQVEQVLYGVTLVLVVLAFGVGLFSGIGLLNYSGKEPVNLVYFLTMVVFIPLVTMAFSLIAMVRADRSQNLLVHISPAFWMEKLLSLFGRKEIFDKIRLNPKLLNWIVIRRSQMMALAFSVGLLVALLGVVVTRDVAFAWSTTLDISADTFWHFTQMVALPWRDWLSQAVPSLELVSQSHYYRLGGHLQENMISQAALLGTWWTFLAMATLFYAVTLRLLIYILATIGLKRVLKEAMLTLDGVALLLKEMNEPLVTTRAAEKEVDFSLRDRGYGRTIRRMEDSYDMVQGWAINPTQLRVICDALGVSASKMLEAGGNNTLDEDEALVKKSEGEIVLFVEAWEPPTMDFVDYLSMLSQKAKRVTVVPVGTVEEGLMPDSKAVDVWLRKIAALKKENIWVKR